MILEDLKKKQLDYYKSKDMERVSVVRFLISAIQNKEIELRPNGHLTDEIIQKVIMKQIKMRNEAIEGYQKVNNASMVDKETKEKAILEEILSEYFPQGANQ